MTKAERKAARVARRMVRQKAWALVATERMKVGDRYLEALHAVVPMVSREIERTPQMKAELLEDWKHFLTICDDAAQEMVSALVDETQAP